MRREVVPEVQVVGPGRRDGGKREGHRVEPAKRDVGIGNGIAKGVLGVDREPPVGAHLCVVEDAVVPPVGRAHESHVGEMGVLGACEDHTGPEHGIEGRVPDIEVEGVDVAVDRE